MTARVAITGATGFVGRHVLEALLARGALVTAGTRGGGAALPGSVVQVPLDLAALPDDLFEALGRPEILVHLAWGGLPNYRSPAHLEEELPRQIRFLEAMAAGGARHILVTGTCFEYGLCEGKLTESDTPRPHLPYGEAKDCLRLHLERLCRDAGIGLTWARLFYLWGEGQAPNSLYPQFCRAVAEGRASFDMSGGEQERDYLHVTEAAEMLARLALGRARTGAVNLCSGEHLRIRDLVMRWRADIGSGIELNLGVYPYPDWEGMAFWGDTARLTAALSRVP